MTRLAGGAAVSRAQSVMEVVTTSPDLPERMRLRSGTPSIHLVPKFSAVANVTPLRRIGVTGRWSPSWLAWFESPIHKHSSAISLRQRGKVLKGRIKLTLSQAEIAYG